MLERVRSSIQDQGLLEPGAALWVAVSGGVDSMVLLTVLKRLGHAPQVIHIDHGLRGEHSAADRDLVQQYCAELGVPFHVEEVDVRKEVARSGASVQMAARDLRYAVFHRLVENGPQWLAMAHHADDAIETLLMNLMQGMGVHGWQGIPARSGPFIRPLLAFTRADILAFARAHRVPWREDASNNDPAYLRARVRHELLPLMEALRPGARTVLQRDLVVASELDRLAGDRSAELLADLRPDAEGILRVPFQLLRASQAPHVLLRMVLEHHHFHPDRIRDMVKAMEQGAVGARFPGSAVEVHVDREAFLVVPVSPAAQEWRITDAHHPPVDLPLRMCFVDASDIDPNAGATVLWLDAERVEFPMTLRPWRAGDRLEPSGMAGSKLVSDLLIDAKFPRHRKDRVLVLCDAQRILWCCGVRAAGYARATSKSKRVLRVELGIV